MRAYELTEFPFSGGVFAPKSNPCQVTIHNVEKSGLTTALIKHTVRVGNVVIPKGSKIASRIRYHIINHTQNYETDIELIGVSKSGEEPKFFVGTPFPLHAGDNVEVKFMDVAFNRAAKNLH